MRQVVRKPDTVEAELILFGSIKVLAAEKPRLDHCKGVVLYEPGSELWEIRAAHTTSEAQPFLDHRLGYFPTSDSWFVVRAQRLWFEEGS